MRTSPSGMPFFPSLLLLPLLALLAAAPAGATLIGQSVQVDLISPNDGNLLLTNNLAVASGPDILPGDGSAIGGVLLSTEFHDLGSGGGDQIVIGLEEGAAGGFTGYGDTARYVFSGLYVGDPLFIDDVVVTASNITGLTPASVSFTGSSVTVFIDDLVIGEIPGINTGTLTLDLLLAIPEPASAALLCLGLAGLAAARRRRPA